MKLFGNKKEEKKSCCCAACTPEIMKQVEQQKQEEGIKVLGSGCAKCVALEKAVVKAIEELELNYKVEHISDFAKIASYGVMSTPALVINGKVVSYGKVLSIEEAKQILKDIKLYESIT